MFHMIKESDPKFPNAVPISSNAADIILKVILLFL